MKQLARFLFQPRHGENSHCICTPDGGFLYLSNKSVGFVHFKEQNEKFPLVQTYNTKQQILQIDIDLARWAEGEKIFATLNLDHSVLIWDVEKCIAISGHKAHCRNSTTEGGWKDNDKQTAVHISFMKNRNLLSLSAQELVVYCLASNTTHIRPNFIAQSAKGQHITALKCSPYDENIFACGTHRGLVLIFDLQAAKVLYTLPGHQTAIVSFAWNTIGNQSKGKKLTKSAAVVVSLNSNSNADDDIFNIYDYDYLENEFGAPVKLNSSNEENIQQEEASNELALNPNFNFQEACENLKQEIRALNQDEGRNEAQECEVTLADCQSTKNMTRTSSTESIESTEGSLELVEHNTSSDESCHVDGKQIKMIELETKAQTVIANECKVESKYVEEIEVRPTKTNVDILLASASSDGHFYVWNTVNGSCCDHLKHTMQKRGIVNTRVISQVQIFWHNDSGFSANTPQGEIVQWNLSLKQSKPTELIRQYKFEKCETLNVSEQRVLDFGISRDSDYLWYITHTNEIVCKKFKTRETVLSYGTCTDFIQAMRESPENNSKIAFSFANRNIAVLDATQLSMTEVKLQFLTARLKSCVKTLVWSDESYNLAYGTVEGQVGIVNVESQQHTTFNIACGRPIYSMAWHQKIIFFISDEKLFAYKVDCRDPIPIEGLIKNARYSYVNVSQKFLFVGNTRGYIDIYREVVKTPTTSNTLIYELSQSIETAKHYITDISFCPLEIEKFAVAANENNVYLLKFEASSGTANIITILSTQTPKASIYKVKWSNRSLNKFVTCGYDGTLRVFDLRRPAKEEIVFTKQFNCPLFSVMLLPTDERYALCTGKSISVEIVDTEDSTAEMHNSKSERALDFIKWATKINSTGNPTTADKRKEKLLAKTNTLAPQCEKLTTTVELSEKVADLHINENRKTNEKNVNVKETTQQNKNSFLKTPKTLLPIITKEENKNPIQKIHEFINQKTFKEKKNVVVIAQLFSTKISAKKLFEMEVQNLESSKTPSAELASIFLKQSNGNIRDFILNAIQARKLTEWHVSLAPTVSYSFWQKCCQAFAEQLLEQGYALHAALYFLGLHKQVEAINLLLAAGYFKEALLIGRVYLLDNDPLLTKITDQWIAHLENNGNLAGAALICTVSEQYERGYEILSKQRVISPDVQATINLLKEQMGT